MYLFRQFEYRLTKADAPGSLFNRAIEVLRDSGHPNVPIRFCFEEFRAAAADRAVRQFAELASYLFTHQPPYDTVHEPHAVLSNLDATWDVPNPRGSTGGVEVGVLAEVMAGIPRAFPFFSALVYFDGIPWTGPGNRVVNPQWISNTGVAARSAFVSSSIEIQSHWGSRTRRNSLTATVQVDTPADASPVLGEVPTSVQQSLDALGRIRRESLLCVPTMEENTQLQSLLDQVGAIRKKYEADYANRLQKLKLPFALPNCDTATPSGLVAIGSLKPALIGAFRPLGYRYQSTASGSGGYVLTKLSPQNHNIEISFDTGSWSKTATGLLAVQGPQWSACLSIWCAPHPQGANYPILNLEIWQRIVANFAVVVEYLEHTFVPEIEQLFPPAPAWYRYER